MHPKVFHSLIDQPRLIAAIAAAERRTSGKIYVYVSHRAIDDALAQAQKRFAKLGFNRLHEYRPAALVYIAPRTHKFAIVGNSLIHERCGEPFWTKLAENLSADLKTGDISAGLLNTVASLDAALTEHFPAATHGAA